MKVEIIARIDGLEVAVVKQEISGGLLDRKNRQDGSNAGWGRRFSNKALPNLLNPYGRRAVLDCP